MMLEGFVEEVGEEDSNDEAEDRKGVAEGLGVVVMEDGDAEEDAVAGHGGGEDVAVVEVDEGVERAAGEGEKDGGGKRVDFAVFGIRHGRLGWSCELFVGSGRQERETAGSFPSAALRVGMPISF